MRIRKKCHHCSKLLLMANFENNDKNFDNKEQECKECKELIIEKNEEMSKDVSVKGEQKETLKAKRIRVAAEVAATKKIDTVDDLIDTLEKEESKAKSKRKSRAKVKVEETVPEEVEEAVEETVAEVEEKVEEIIEEKVEEIIEEKVKTKTPKKGSKKVEQVTLVDNVPTDEIVATWDSVRVAGEGIGKSSAGIRNVCRGVNKSAHGFFWRYKTEVE